MRACRCRACAAERLRRATHRARAGAAPPPAAWPATGWCASAMPAARARISAISRKRRRRWPACCANARSAGWCCSATRSSQGALLEIEEFPELGGLPGRSNGATWCRSTVCRTSSPGSTSTSPAGGRQPVLRGEERAEIFRGGTGRGAAPSPRPTGPFRRAIRDGVTGFLARTRGGLGRRSAAPGRRCRAARAHRRRPPITTCCGASARGARRNWLRDLLGALDPAGAREPARRASSSDCAAAPMPRRARPTCRRASCCSRRPARRGRGDGRDASLQLRAAYRGGARFGAGADAGDARSRRRR